MPEKNGQQIDPNKVSFLSEVSSGGGQGFTLFVKANDGTKILTGIKITDKVESIKGKVAAKTGIAVEEQRLIFGGKQLEDGRTVADYNLQKESTLHLLQRLRGGRLPDNVLGNDFDIAGNLSHLKRLVILIAQDGRIDSNTMKEIEVAFSSSAIDPLRTGEIGDGGNTVSTRKNLLELVQGDTNSPTDQADWKAVIQIIARKRPDLLYKKPEDATAKLSGPRLKFFTKIKTATLKILNEAASGKHDGEIKKIFGDTNLGIAKGKYGNAALALEKLWKHFDSDLNGDDAEINLGGFAQYGYKIHLAESFFNGSDADAIILLAHECSHLGNADVIDLGYDGTPLYEGLSENVKLRNADHFAELARRILNKSHYAKTNNDVFKPVDMSGNGGGNAPNIYQVSSRLASEQLRQAWTAGMRLLIGFRDVFALGEINHLSKDPVKFGNFTHEKLFEWLYGWATELELPMKDHTGNNKITITKLDLSLLEALTRRLNQFGGRCPYTAVQNDKDPYYKGLQTKEGLVAGNIERAIKMQGTFYNNINTDIRVIGYMARNVDRISNPI